MDLCPKWYTRWKRRRAILRTAKYATAVAEERARRRLAAYTVKSELEWDMRWASPLDKTWRDELIVIAWSVPLVGLFIPGINTHILMVLEHLKTIDPNVPAFFVWGWGIIFVATFGVKQVKSLFLPGRLAGLVSALGSAPDDVPEDTAKAAQEAINPN